MKKEEQTRVWKEAHEEEEKEKAYNKRHKEEHPEEVKRGKKIEK